jgi:predicted Kef-type K+ transport protein
LPDVAGWRDLDRHGNRSGKFVGSLAQLFEVIIISFAFFFGLAIRQIGLPPLVGFLAAGFAMNIFGPSLGMPDYTDETLHHVAHLGVLMLLFTVGLKLKLEQIAQPQVVGGALVHFAISVLVFMPGLKLFMGLDWNTALLLAIALSFSSTVLAAKLLETKRELGAFHGRTAIGILIVQDIIALVVLAVWSGQTPNASGRCWSSACRCCARFCTAAGFRRA